MTNTNLMLRAGLALCLMATACAQEEEAEISSFCVESVGEGDDARLRVSVAFVHTCLTSCDTVTDSGCTIAEADGELVIDAYTLVQSKGRRCDAICGTIPDVSCEIAVDPGTDVTLRLEDLVLDYSFPSAEPACASDPS